MNKQKLLLVSGILAIVTGIVCIAGGGWGVIFTYKNVAQEKIVTPKDASRPEKKVIGPLTLKSQADIIREHTLARTQGKTYAEMPREVPARDAVGNEILDVATGKAVMVPNETRELWITATTLMTALHLGMITYALSILVLLLGGISLWNGIVILYLTKGGSKSRS